MKDSHGSVRRLRESGQRPGGAGVPLARLRGGRPHRRRARPEGFSSPDNLVFDSAGNLWVVTDISSSRLNQDNEYAYHRNNAMFMVPTSGPNPASPSASPTGRCSASCTGPYFTPDEQTLFVNVQHPGEQTGTRRRRRVRPGADLHQLVARGQPQPRGQPGHPEALDGGDHARVAETPLERSSSQSSCARRETLDALQLDLS